MNARRLRWLLIPACFVLCCGDRPVSTEATYREAETLRRRGEVRHALELLERSDPGPRPDMGPEWPWKYRLLRAEILLELRAVDNAERLIRAGGTAPTVELRVRQLTSLAFVRRLKGDLQQARDLIAEAYQLASSAGLYQLMPLVELRRAFIAGSSPAAEGYIRSALSIAQAQGDRHMEGLALLDLGYYRLAQSRFDEAIPWLEASRKVAEQTGAQRMEDRALGNLGWCYYRLGDADLALQHLLRAAYVARRVHDVGSLHLWLNNLGNVYHRRGEYDRALSYFQQAAEVARGVPNPEGLAHALVNLVRTSLSKGDLVGAERFNRQAADSLDKMTARGPILYSRIQEARIAHGRRDFTKTEAVLRELIPAARQASETPVLWEAQTELADVLAETGRVTEADAEFRNALATIDQEWGRLNEDRYRVTFLAPLIVFYKEYVGFLGTRGQAERAASVADSARARVLAQNLGRTSTAKTTNYVPRRNGEVVLSYWLGQPQSFLWVSGPGGLAQFILPRESEIAALVNRYSASILDGSDPLQRENPHGKQLYRTLVEPAAALIPAGARVLVIPDGALHGLNFETLLVDGPRPHYWIEDVTVAVAPSLGILETASARSRKPYRLLLIGDPVYEGSGFAALRNLKQEVAAVARHFPTAAVFTGEQANPLSYRRSEPQRFSVIHFAAHATANPESPLNSAVILSQIGAERKLYAKDVLDLRLDAELVTISACESAGARAYPGEGLMGFTWAFMQAGARNVVAGIWEADDGAAPPLMERFYETFSTGASPIEALHEAKLAMLRSNGPYRRPYFWASFQVFTRAPR